MTDCLWNDGSIDATGTDTNGRSGFSDRSSKRARPPRECVVEVPSTRYHRTRHLIMQLPRVPITNIEKPIKYSGIVTRCKNARKPMALVGASPIDPDAISFGGATFLMRYGAVDNNFKSEIYTVDLAAGAYLPPSGDLLPFTAMNIDLLYIVISGQVVFSVGDVVGNAQMGAQVTYGQGGSAGIKGGTPHIVQATSDGPATLAVTALPAGILEFYKAAEAYQKSVGGAQFVDRHVLRRMGRELGIKVLAPKTIPQPGPGVATFLPGPPESSSSNNTDCGRRHRGGGYSALTPWGTGCYQILVFESVLPSPPGPLAPGVLKLSASMMAKTTRDYIQLQSTATSVTIRALVIRDPSSGTATVEHEPTINGALTATLAAGATYAVHYDAVANNVYIATVV